MSTLSDYAANTRASASSGADGILLMTLHTDGGSLQWGFGPHGELPRRFTMSGRPRQPGRHPDRHRG